MLNNIFREYDNSIEFFVYLTPGAKKEAILGIIFIDELPYIKNSYSCKTNRQSS